VLDEGLPSAAELVNRPKWSAASSPVLLNDRPQAGDVPERHTLFGGRRDLGMLRLQSGDASGCGAALRGAPILRRQSPAVTFGTNGIGRSHRGVRGEPALQAGAQVIEGRVLCNLTNLGQQIVGQRHAGPRSARFEFATQGLWYIVDLDDACHGEDIRACRTRANGCRTTGTPLRSRSS
jgi:hypothetical protein